MMPVAAAPQRRGSAGCFRTARRPQGCLERSSRGGVVRDREDELHPFRPEQLRAVTGAAAHPHSLSRLVQQMLAGDLTPHRRIAVDEEVPELPEPSTPAQTRVACGRDDARWAWDKRRGDLNDLAGIDEVLAEIDARAKELERRTAAVLSQTPTMRPIRRSPEFNVACCSPFH